MTGRRIMRQTTALSAHPRDVAAIVFDLSGERGVSLVDEPADSVGIRLDLTAGRAETQK